MIQHADERVAWSDDNDEKDSSGTEDDETVCLKNILFTLQKILCSFYRFHQQEKSK